jgi:hypothetical protein
LLLLLLLSMLLLLLSLLLLLNLLGSVVGSKHALRIKRDGFGPTSRNRFRVISRNAHGRSWAYTTPPESVQSAVLENVSFWLNIATQPAIRFIGGTASVCCCCCCCCFYCTLKPWTMIGCRKKCNARSLS